MYKLLLNQVAFDPLAYQPGIFLVSVPAVYLQSANMLVISPAEAALVLPATPATQWISCWCMAVKLPHLIWVYIVRMYRPSMVLASNLLVPLILLSLCQAYIRNTVLLHAGASAIPDLGPIDIGKARRTGQTVSPSEDSQGFPQAQFAPELGAATNGNGAASVAETSAATTAAISGNGASAASMSMDATQSQVCSGKQKWKEVDCVLQHSSCYCKHAHVLVWSEFCNNGNLLTPAV